MGYAIAFVYGLSVGVVGLFMLASWYGSRQLVEEIVATRPRVIIDRTNPRQRLEQIRWLALLDKEHLDAMAEEACEICGVVGNDYLTDLVRGIVEHGEPVANVLDKLVRAHEGEYENE
jgi:hypothetical protein